MKIMHNSIHQFSRLSHIWEKLIVFDFTVPDLSNVALQLFVFADVLLVKKNIFPQMQRNVFNIQKWCKMFALKYRTTNTSKIEYWVMGRQINIFIWFWKLPSTTVHWYRLWSFLFCCHISNAHQLTNSPYLGLKKIFVFVLISILRS